MTDNEQPDKSSELNPFIFNDAYPDKDISDYNAEEAYEMGVSAGLDSGKAKLASVDNSIAQARYDGATDTNTVVTSFIQFVIDGCKERLAALSTKDKGGDEA